MKRKRKDTSLDRQCKMTYREHYDATTTSHRAGVRSGYIEGWFEGQIAMKEACLHRARGQCADHEFMVNEFENTMSGSYEGCHHWAAKNVFTAIFGQPFIEPDHNGEWSDHKPSEQPPVTRTKGKKPCQNK